jgi:uncharacterized protein
VYPPEDPVLGDSVKGSRVSTRAGAPQRRAGDCTRPSLAGALSDRQAADRVALTSSAIDSVRAARLLPVSLWLVTACSATTRPVSVVPTASPCVSAPFTPAFAIQGRGAATPIPGPVTTVGVVVGAYQGPAPALRGFYLQDATGDGDASTSDAVFVFTDDAQSVSLGEVVRVTGEAEEAAGQTQVRAASVEACGVRSTIAPVDILLPVAEVETLERYEGMLVRFPQTLTVTEHFQLARFGQVVLSAGGRLRQPTDVVPPGDSARALQARNDRHRIIVDDELNAQNREPIVFGRGGAPLSAANTLRGGDEITGLVGVLTYTSAGNAASGAAYRVRPIGALGGGAPAFRASNARPVAAPAVGGTLRVASFNLLNYSNTFGNACTNGVNGAVSSCRGASNAEEFARQRAKTVAALRVLDADIVGVIEIENDGYGAESAIADLVRELNAGPSGDAYAFVDVDAATGRVNALGDDGIKVGLLYKPSRVRPVARTAVLGTEAFVTGGDRVPRNRPSLAQAFEQDDGARLVVNVNHLKSKGGACAEPDAGDGQAECNAVRVRAAMLLRDWLATDPTGANDPDVLILGDLNAYAREDPVVRLEAAGYVNLTRAFVGAGSYSYGFDGQWGSLDHALASASLRAQVVGATDVHINADEPTALDFNTEFKSPAMRDALYAPDPFRSSDHDPVLVGLSLQPPPSRRAPGGGTFAGSHHVPLRFSAHR